MPTDVRQARPHATVQRDRLDDLQLELDHALEAVRPRLGATHPMYIGGRAVTADTPFEDRSPIDTPLLPGRFQSAAPGAVDDAAAAAQEAAVAWRATRWSDRVEVLRRLAALIHANRLELSRHWWNAGSFARM